MSKVNFQWKEEKTDSVPGEERDIFAVDPNVEIVEEGDEGESERLAEVAKISKELNRRYEDERLNYYRPCCKSHQNECPKYPCLESSHTKFHLSDKRIRIVFGGNRSAKSTTGLVELLMMACYKKHPIRGTANPFPGRWRIYAPDFGLLEKVMIPKIKYWIPKSALKYDGKSKEEAWEKSFDPRYHVLELKGGSLLDLMSYDQDASKSESDELDGVLADEQMPENIYDAVMARLITRKGKFMMAVTPLYDLSWAMRFTDNPNPMTDVFRWEIWDNPYNSETSIKEFENAIQNPLEKEARLHGRFMEFQGLVYKELRVDYHRIQRSTAKTHYPIVFALDPHPRKPSVMTWAYITPKNDIVFFDELEMHGTAKELVSVIRGKESSHPGKTMLRLIDPAAKAQGSDIAFETDTLREFEREGMSFTLADNSDAGYGVVHDYLGYDISKPIGAMNRPRCFFTDEVPKTWYGMTHLFWDEWNFKKSMRDEKERIKDYKKDFPDCVRYTLAYRPTYRNFGFSSPLPIGNMAEAIDYERRILDQKSVLAGII